LNVHDFSPGSSEPLGPQQSRDHVDGDDDRPRTPEHGDHRHTRLNAAASAAKAMNAPAPTARKITSAMPASSAQIRAGKDHGGA
jgi:hypothetical protein